MTSLPRSTDVLVIGGGPAGLAAAIAARRRGMDVVVTDHAVPPIDKACGEGIMPDGIAAARVLGIDLHAIPSHPFRGIRFYDGAASVQADFPAGHGLGVRRVELHAAMVEAAVAAGVHLAWGVRTIERAVRARWIVGADGSLSTVRRSAGLDASHHESRRYGFRRHYRVARAPEYMELHWGERRQIYVTPVGEDEVCVVLISRDPALRLADVPLDGILAGATPLNTERGGVTVSRRLRHVTRGNVALVGDASGSVDAITGEGLCLLFQQSIALAEALACGELASYEAEHARIGRRPRMMAELMLMLDRSRGLRGRIIRAMSADPRLFARMLALHTGALPVVQCVADGLALGWKMLTV